MESKTSRQAMDENSSKHLLTCNSQADALRSALVWLDREGRGQRNARALRQLLDATLVAVSRGDAPPEKDTTTLRQLLQQIDGDDATPSKSFRAAELETWWAARAEQLRQECNRQGCRWMPRLVVKPGGGRNLPSRLLFEFETTADPELAADVTEPSTGNVVMHYRMEPAKPAFWLRLLVGSRPFPIQSWRGYLLLAIAATTMLLIGLMWFGHYALWSRGQPLTTAALAQLGLVCVVTAGLWWISKPIRELPTARVTIAGPVFLALSELYGQLRTMRASDGKLKSREFSVVRHWGICPICSAEVDVDDGRKAFPDRLVGRCHDAPWEHVFSFDPVRLVGRHLL